jgi:hypothetical protein
MSGLQKSYKIFWEFLLHAAFYILTSYLRIIVQEEISIEKLPLINIQSLLKFHVFPLIFLSGAASHTAFTCQVSLVSSNLCQFLSLFLSFSSLSFMTLAPLNTASRYYVFVWYFLMITFSLGIFGMITTAVMLCSFHCIIAGDMWYWCAFPDDVNLETYQYYVPLDIIHWEKQSMLRYVPLLFTGLGSYLWKKHNCIHPESLNCVEKNPFQFHLLTCICLGLFICETNKRLLLLNYCIVWFLSLALLAYLIILTSST